MGLFEKEPLTRDGVPLSQGLSLGSRTVVLRRLIQSAASALIIIGFLMVADDARTQQTSFQVVANPSLATDSITKRELAGIFLKRTKTWSNGQAAIPVDQKNASAVREVFSVEILGKGVNAVESYWNGQVFSGKEGPPRSMGSDTAVIDFVRTTPGAVGYVSAGASTSGVKVLRIDG